METQGRFFNGRGGAEHTQRSAALAQEHGEAIELRTAGRHCRK